MPTHFENSDIDLDSINSPMIGFAMDNYSPTEGEHCHKKGQLLYCSKGVTHFFCEGQYFLLPPSKAAWIPPDLKHDVQSKNIVSYRSLYLDVRQFGALPNSMQILQIDLLFKLLIEKFCTFDIHYSKHGPEFHLAMVIVDMINRASTLPLSLPSPKEARLHKIFEMIIHSPSDIKTVHEYAKEVHITTRTLNRIAQKELGMSFEKWRIALRLMYAFELLEQQLSITEISQRLGYSNDSSFIARFKQWIGETPAQYQRKMRL